MSSFKLYCRSCYIGTLLIPDDALPRGGEEPIRAEIQCRHNNCKKAGVFPHHVFVINENTDPARVRPVDHIYQNPGLPTEVIGRPEE